MIERIDIDTHAFAIKWAGTQQSLWEPQNRETADHSIPFMTALALTRGEIDHHAIEAAMGDSAVRALTRKVRLREDPAFSAAWPKNAPARMRILARGQEFSMEVLAGLGHASRPAPPEKRAAKLLDNATHVIGADRAAAWVARVEALPFAPTLGALLAP